MPYKISLSTLQALSLSALLFLSTTASSQSGNTEPILVDTTIRQLGFLKNEQITESSGLALSTRDPNVLWTHNDSGDKARIFALDLTGRHLGEFIIEDESFKDFEDIVSYEYEGKHRLLIGDVGNNRSKRNSGTIYVVKEPKLTEDHAKETESISIIRKFKYQYDNGPQNCESLAIDAATRTLYFVEKNQIWNNDHVATIYEMPWPKKKDEETPIAKSIGTMSFPIEGAMTMEAARARGTAPFMTTASDMSRDGTRFVVSTYTTAYEYLRSQGQTWAEAFKSAPRRLNMPVRRQGESICYSSDGKSMYLTSELLPSPLWEVRPKE
jgi:hypothetical protein